MPNYAIELEWERCPDGVEVVVRLEPPPREGLPFGLDLDADMRPIPRPVTWVSGEAAQAEIERLRYLDMLARVLKGPQVGWPEMPSSPTGSHRWLKPRTPRRTAITLRADTFEHPIIMEFINANGEQRLIEFVYEYGIPSGKDADGVALAYIEDSQRALEALLWCHQFADHALAVRVFQHLAQDWAAAIFPRLTIPSRADTPILTLVPRNLLGYMLLEAGMIMSGNTRVMRCVHCGKVFISGTHGGKRKTAIYCSNRCRVAAQRALAKQVEGGA